jgi:DnaK suppressor protein
MATMIQRIRSTDHARHDQLAQLLNRQGTIMRNRKENLRNGLPTEMSGVLDMEERALDSEEQGIDWSVLQLTSQTVQGIEAALKRLEAGELGTCSDCLCRIPAVRLRALPFATLCLACQARHDDVATGAATN